MSADPEVPHGADESFRRAFRAARAHADLADVAASGDTRGLSGPAEDLEPAERGFQVHEVGGALVLLRPAPSGPELMFQALISGRVAVLPGGCIGLAGGRGREGHLVAWPSTTTFAPDEMAIQVPGLGVLRIGDFVQAGGGSWSSSNMALPPAIAPCATREVSILNEVQEQQSRADRRRRWRA